MASEVTVRAYRGDSVARFEARLKGMSGYFVMSAIWMVFLLVGSGLGWEFRSRVRSLNGHSH